MFAETMRGGETALVIVELLKNDSNGMKTLEKTHYY